MLKFWWLGKLNLLLQNLGTNHREFSWTSSKEDMGSKHFEFGSAFITIIAMACNMTSFLANLTAWASAIRFENYRYFQSFYHHFWYSYYYFIIIRVYFDGQNKWIRLFLYLFCYVIQLELRHWVHHGKMQGLNLMSYVINLMNLICRDKSEAGSELGKLPEFWDVGQNIVKDSGVELLFCMGLPTATNLIVFDIRIL